MRGKFIAVEGPDGSGKSTLIAALHQQLQASGVECLLLREPGGTALGEQLRALLKGQPVEVAIGDRAEALLFAAARAQILDEVVRPALENGQWVLIDRFVDSSLAYQGLGRGLGVEAVMNVNRFALNGFAADLTLVLQLSVEAAAQRMQQRDGDNADRMEKTGTDFHRRVLQGYQRAIQENPTARAVDASGDPQQVLAAAWRQVEPLLEQKP